MKRYLPGVLASAPVVLGLGLALLLEQGVLPNLLLLGTFQVDLAGLAFWSGVLLSLVAWGVLALQRWANHRVVRAREAVRDAQQAAHRRFLWRLDHEMKNPLTIIRVGVTNLQDSPDLAPEQARSLARVAEQANRLQELVRDLRMLADLEECDLEQAPVDLQEVLKEAIALACSAPEQSGREVALNLQQVPWPVATVWGDRDLLVLAFRNLLDNALKFTTADDSVEVRAIEDGDMAVVEVADSGPGIPPDELPHIFEELYRGRNARHVPGSGLGLALVQRVVTLHGGKITVRSRVGQGTVVTVRLLLAPEGE